MSETQTTPEPVIACDLHAISPDRREQHIALSKALFAMVSEVREMPEGYGFRLPAENAVLMQAAEFISDERLCCPFFGFNLRVEAASAALWLELTGSADVKMFIRAEIGTLLPETMAF